MQFDFGPSVPSGFVFTRDGKALVGSSYYTGVSNIFRYDLETEEVSALSNAETGFFRPVPRPEDSDLFVFRYSGEGFVATRIEAKPLEDVSAITFFGERLVEAHPVLKDWMVGSPNDVEDRGEAARQGALPPRRRPPARIDLSRSCRDTRTPRRSACGRTSPIRCS